MKKWMMMIGFGGTISTLVLVGSASAPTAAAGADAAVATDAGTDPCPTCCPLHICGWNGPSFDGTTPPMAPHQP